MAEKKTPKKRAPDQAVLDSIRRMRAIRRNARSSPIDSIGDRLKTIEGLAGGKISPGSLRPTPSTVAEISKRMEDARRARTDRKGREEGARAERDGHDRRERAGQDRSE